MNKGQLVEAVAARLGATRAGAGRMIEAVIDSIVEGVMKDTSVSIAGFGTFARKHRPARVVRHPATGDLVQIKPSETVNFKASRALTDHVSSPERPAPARRLRRARRPRAAACSS